MPDATTTAFQTAVFTLPVSDLTRSQRFYMDNFGFVVDPSSSDADTFCLVSPLLAHGYRALCLVRGRGATTIQRVTLELESKADLAERYQRALAGGVRATPILTRGRLTSTTVTDPDGHQITVAASDPDRERRGEVTVGVGRWARPEGGAPATVSYGARERAGRGGTAAGPWNRPTILDASPGAGQPVDLSVALASGFTL